MTIDFHTSPLCHYCHKSQVQSSGPHLLVSALSSKNFSILGAERFHKKPTSRLDSPKPCVSQLAANEDSSSTFYFTYELLESNSLNHAANVMEHTVKVTRCVTPNVNNLITV